MKDLHNHLSPVRALSPVSVSDDTAQVCQIVDRQGFDSLEYVILTGSLADADATFVILLEEGDASNLSDAAAVADADMLGTETTAAFRFDDDNEVRKLGYIGNKRYTRLTITPATNTGAALLAVVAILGHKHFQPTDTLADD